LQSASDAEENAELGLSASLAALELDFERSFSQSLDLSSNGSIGVGGPAGTSTSTTAAATGSKRVENVGSQTSGRRAREEVSVVGARRCRVEACNARVVGDSACGAIGHVERESSSAEFSRQHVAVSMMMTMMI
jgi:hypothetical protein